MKKIVSAIVLITMLLSTVLMVIPASAATTVTDATTFNSALKAASGDTTITVASGTTVTLTSLTWPSDDATVTITGGGTVDLSGIATVNMGCGLIFDGVSVVFRSGGTVYAEGHPLTIKSNVTVSYKDADGNVVTGTSISMTIYGGSGSKSITGDTYLDIQSGIYTRIYGGSNGKRVSGNTNVIIGTEGAVNNNTLVGWSDTTHGSTYQFFGGNNGGVVMGNTNITVGSNAYADYVVGGNNGGGYIDGYANMYFSGYAYGLYGGSRGGNTMNDVNLVMTGGGVCDIFGGSNGYAVGSTEDPSNVMVKIFGGEIRRRVYVGSYNDDYDNGTGYVYGVCTLMIGGSPNFSYGDSNPDRGIFAHSRHKSSSALSCETKRIIFLDGKTYTVGRDSGDLGGSWTIGSGYNPSTKHNMTYAVTEVSATEKTLTETCSCGCGHSDSVTLSLKNGKNEYYCTGYPIECATLTYGSSWMSGPFDSFGYENNVEPGTATAIAKVNLSGDKTLSATFTIYDGNGFVDGTPGSNYDQMGNIDVSYTVGETYELNVPSAISLGGLDEGVSTELSITGIVLDIRRVIKVYVASQNGFNVVDSSADNESISYTLSYNDTTVSEGTGKNDVMTVRWNDDENSEACELTFTRKANAVNGNKYTDLLTFSTETLYDEVVPLINGQSFDTDARDVGDGSLLYVKEKVASTYDEGVTVFNDYVTDLESTGYVLYTENQIAENHFATLYSKTQIVNVMYIDYYKDIRVVTDLTSEFDLPGLEMENSYQTWAEYTPNLTLIGGIGTNEIKWPGRMGYVYQLDDGSFFIIDGGYMKANNPSTTAADFTSPLPADAQLPSGNYGSAVPALMELLEKYAPDKNNIVIAAWFITHTHEDHYGAFLDISLLKEYADFKSRLTIEQFIYNKSSDTDVAHLDDLKGNTDNSRFHNAYQAAIDSWSEDQLLSKVKAHPGQVFYLRNLKMTVYTSQDLLHGSEHYVSGDKYDPFITGGASDGSDSKYINNTSITVMIDFMDKKALYLADSSAGTNPYVIATAYATAIAETQILQVAHHGYGDTAASTTYGYIVKGGNLEVVFWPTNSNHFYGAAVPDAYKDDSNTASTLGTGQNQQLFKTGAKVYVHGQDNITITDFVNYEVDELASPYQLYYYKDAE